MIPQRHFPKARELKYVILFSLTLEAPTVENNIIKFPENLRLSLSLKQNLTETVISDL